MTATEGCFSLSGGLLFVVGFCRQKDGKKALKWLLFCALCGIVYYV